MITKKTLVLLSLLAFVFPFATATAGSYAQDKKEAAEYALGLIRARRRASETLAKSPSPITEKAFIESYGKVYAQIQDIRKKKGFIITFSSLKPRNPQNAATPFEARLISRFRTDRAFKKFWTVTMVQGRSYSRLIMPVFAEKSCLACHGPRDKRPAFIAKRYAGDRSSGFKDGEIMGLISLYMPDEEE